MTDLLRTRVKELFRHLPKGLAGDQEAIHQMRVAGRRLQVALPLLAKKPEGRRVRRSLEVLRELTRTAGGSRDLDVSLDSWIVVPTDPVTPGNWAYCALIACALALPVLHGWKRDALVVPTLYVAAFVWETRLVGEPSITRQLLLGALLIVMMLARPQGLIGKARVERV
jgi:hypothetical protein